MPKLFHTYITLPEPAYFYTWRVPTSCLGMTMFYLFL
uniref:Uncharacterized protein n=1 Tax=Arundo donax TaxID=35708 RepID=A0A0A9BJW6_ARUDO